MDTADIVNRILQGPSTTCPKNYTRKPLVSNDGTLDCSFRYVGTLKKLNIPETTWPILNIQCESCQLTSFECIPHNESIQHINCANNRLTSLMEVDCINLRRLHCQINFINNLRTRVQCTYLVYLCCHSNNITSFDGLADFAPNLRHLVCNKNKITSFTGLPQGLLYLHCQDNQITSFHGLPNNISTVDCRNNPIKPDTITELPDSLRCLDYKYTPAFDEFGGLSLDQVYNFKRGIILLRKLKLHYIIYKLWMTYWHYTLDINGFSRFIKYKALQDYNKHFQ